MSPIGAFWILTQREKSIMDVMGLLPYGKGSVLSCGAAEAA